jgi:hypothetical protein
MIPLKAAHPAANQSNLTNQGTVIEDLSALMNQTILLLKNQKTMQLLSEMMMMIQWQL